LGAGFPLVALLIWLLEQSGIRRRARLAGI
jgi:hypothetical protein